MIIGFINNNEYGKAVDLCIIIIKYYGINNFLFSDSSVLSLLGFELTRGYYLAGDEIHYEERRERVYTFMSTPLELEKVSTDYWFFCLYCEIIGLFYYKK